MVSSKRGADHATSPSNKRQKSCENFTAAERQTCWKLLLEFQAEALLPDSFVELLSCRRFCEWLNTKCNRGLPRRQVLCGPVLDEYADVYDRQQCAKLADMQNNSGGRVNFLSDICQNIAKQHLLGCQLSLFGVVMTYALRRTGSDHHVLAIASQMEEILVEMQEAGWNVGAIGTDNAGQCGRARRILALRWPRICFLRCFAHDINNLVKAVLKRAFKNVSEEAAAVVNVLNASSEMWLVRVNNAMIARYGRNPPPALIPLCITRCNSMQKCFASLLRVRSALEDFLHAFRKHRELPEKLRVLGKPQFWRSLEGAEQVIRPLCIASYRLQRDENTLGDVVRSFGDIYKGFAASEHADTLVMCVEQRWSACEQPLFMLGYFLHPHFVGEARKFPPTYLTKEHEICEIALYYYRRLIDEDVAGLRGEMSSWFVGTYTNVPLSDFGGSVIEYWTYLQRNNSDKLPSLALTILSIAVNTATYERLFSELGLIHSPRRNQTRAEKTLKQQIVRQHVREQNRQARPAKLAAKYQDKVTVPLDPNELPCIRSPVRTTPLDDTNLRCPVSSQRESTPGRCRAGQLVQDDTAIHTPRHDRYTTPQRRATSQSRLSTPRQQLASVNFLSLLSSNMDGQTQLCESQHGQNASEEEISTPQRRQFYCGAGNLSVLRTSPEHATPASISRNLVGDFSTAQENDDENVSGLGNGDVDGDETCIAVWENAIVDTSTENDARTEDDENRGNYLDAIPVPDRQSLPAENVANFPQESRLHGIRARKVKLQDLFPILQTAETS